jgi:ABC-2 type transport system permease protein
MSSRLRRFALRVLAMASKEVIHIRRDPRTLYMALGMPAIMLLLFGFGLSFDVDRVPLLVVDDDHSQASRALTRRVFAGDAFEPAGEVDAGAAEDLIRRGRALGALVFPPHYERFLLLGQDAEVQLLLDGSDGNLARQIMSKLDGVTAAETLARAGLPGRPPLSVKVYTLFNPTGQSTFFMVPGLAAYLLAIAAVLLTALTVAGEWERGSMEQLFASPVGRLEIVLGKLVPYLVLGMVQLLLVLTLATLVFGVPVRGSLLLVFLAGFLFIAGMLAQGLVISVLARNQLVATQAGALSSLLPSLVLSGMIVPIENMPRVLQAMAVVVPGRYLVESLRTLMLKGGGLSTIAGDLLAMLAFVVAMLALATTKFKRRLA